MLYVWYQQNGTAKAIILRDKLKECLGVFYGVVEKWLTDNLPKDFWLCGQDLADAAKSRGTKAHDAIERWAKNGVWAYEKDIEPAISAFKKFIDENHIKIVETEIALASNKYKYAGRTDIIAEVNGKLAILDVKTSSAFYPEMGLQLSAYKQAYFEMTGVMAEEMWIIRIDNKTGELQTKRYEDSLNVFLSALDLWSGLKVMGTGTVKAPKKSKEESVSKKDSDTLDNLQLPFSGDSRVQDK
jgi:hypothetical protein